MSNIVSAFMGVILGGLFSLFGTWLSLRGRTDYFDDLALKHLSEMLRKNKNTGMTELISWGKSIGMTEPETRQLVFVARTRLGYPVDAEKAESKIS